MAELNNESTDGASSKKIRSRKLTSKVDLTAMVDLAFLLIYFFYADNFIEQTQIDAIIDAGTNRKIDAD